ncbi:MAG: hypothetical protein EPO20_07240 [Betaproteobacteria bacterium]|nr:MAG: hypothetical protein EPO20_07240 [Betaproteobacteria bacterium]
MAEARATLANRRAAPHNRWAFHHVREIVPGADIPNDRRRVRELRVQPAKLELDRFSEQADTDGMAILQRGRLVFERYANGTTPQSPHILVSVSKSMLGLPFYSKLVESDGAHGGPMHYVSPNSVIARLSSQAALEIRKFLA